MTDVLKITQKDTNRIKRLKQVTGADDRYINYNYPGANEAYQRSIDAAKRLTEQGIKASPINPRDEAKANIKEMQQGGALSPLPRGKHQVGVYLNWGDWKPGGPSVKELVNQLKIQNGRQDGNLSFKHSPVPGMPPPTPYPNEPYYPKPGPLKPA